MRQLALGIFWVVTMLGGVLGLAQLGSALTADSAPRQAAAAALALAFPVIPYCFTRALSEIGK